MSVRARSELELVILGVWGELHFDEQYKRQHAFRDDDEHAARRQCLTIAHQPPPAAEAAAARAERRRRDSLSLFRQMPERCIVERTLLICVARLFSSPSPVRARRVWLR